MCWSLLAIKLRSLCGGHVSKEASRTERFLEEQRSCVRIDKAHHPIPINPSWVSHYTTAESQLLQMWPTKPGIVCLLKRGTSKTRSSAQKCWKWPCVVLGKQVQLGFLELTIRKQFLKACCLWSTQTFISVSAQKFQLCILWCVKFENIRKPYPKPLALKKKSFACKR